MSKINKRIVFKTTSCISYILQLYMVSLSEMIFYLSLRATLTLPEMVSIDPSSKVCIYLSLKVSLDLSWKNPQFF